MAPLKPLLSPKMSSTTPTLRELINAELIIVKLLWKNIFADFNFCGCDVLMRFCGILRTRNKNNLFHALHTFVPSNKLTIKK